MDHGFGRVSGSGDFYGPVRNDPQTPEEWARFYEAKIAQRREWDKANRAAREKRAREMAEAKAEAARRAEAMRAKAQADEEATIARSLRLRGAAPSEIPALVKEIRRARLLGAGNDTGLPSDPQYRRM